MSWKIIFKNRCTLYLEVLFKEIKSLIILFSWMISESSINMDIESLYIVLRNLNIDYIIARNRWGKPKDNKEHFEISSL